MNYTTLIASFIAHFLVYGMMSVVWIIQLMVVDNPFSWLEIVGLITVVASVLATIYRIGFDSK